MKRLLGLLALGLALLGGPVLASNCPTYPYNLTNGQTADANQVMADFNSILTCANTTLLGSPISGSLISAGTIPSTALASGVAIANLGYTPLNPANNLSEVTAATARTNLGAAALASPTFTGTPAAPTASVGTNTTQIATTAFVLANLGTGNTGTVTCGTGCVSVVSGSKANSFQVVGGTSVASIAVNFTTTWSSQPVCVAVSNSGSGGGVVSVVASTTAVTIATFSASTTLTLNVICRAIGT